MTYNKTILKLTPYVPHERGNGPPPVPQEILDVIQEKYLDIAYCADSPSQMLDLYLPNDCYEERLPVVIHFHGGAFRVGGKRNDDCEPMMRCLDRGYAFVSAEYRKSGEARFPAMVYDAKAVIRWVRANADKYGLDADKIALWGPSAGGWLCSFVAATNGNPAFEDLDMGNAAYSSAVNAVVDWCGPNGGFLAMDDAFKASGIDGAVHNAPDSPESAFLGANIVDVPELVRLASPATHVSRDMPPVIIFHGEADPVVPVQQSKTFYEAVVKAAGAERAELHIYPGGGHHGEPWYHEEWVSEACLDFLDKVFRRS